MKEIEAVKAAEKFLHSLGLNLNELGMEKTPQRITKLYAELFSGLGPVQKEEWGELFASSSTGMAVIRSIPFYSMCEHHLVPFWGSVDLVYQPRAGLVAGLGSFSRVVTHLARRPQLQERFTAQLAEEVMAGTKAEGVLAVVRARQFCLMMHSNTSPETEIVTTECRGIFQQDKELLHQAWQLLGKGESN